MKVKKAVSGGGPCASTRAHPRFDVLYIFTSEACSGTLFTRESRRLVRILSNANMVYISVRGYELLVSVEVSHQGGGQAVSVVCDSILVVIAHCSVAVVYTYTTTSDV